MNVISRILWGVAVLFLVATIEAAGQISAPQSEHAATEAVSEVQPDQVGAPQKSNLSIGLWYAQRIVAVLVGGFAIYLGYRLFILGVTGKASLSVKTSALSGRLLNAAPGLFFAIGGIVIVVVAIWKT